MNDPTSNVSIVEPPLPPDKMRTFVLQLISYDQLIANIAAGVVRGSVTQLDRIINLIIQLQHETGTMIIDGFELPVEDVAHRLLQTKYYDIELILRDMTGRKKRRFETDQQLVHALYNIIGSLRSYQYRQRRGRSLR